MADPNTQMNTRAQREADYERFKTYAATGFLVAAPVAFCVSANHITRERTGRSIVDRIEARITTRPAVLRELPSERAQEIQARLRAAREAQMKEAVGEELEKLKAREAQEQGVVQRVWMGGEAPGWMERRLQEEQKALEEGKGYGDLISRAHLGCVELGKKGGGGRR
ncbi:hypothetical protein N7509_006199 [Penicillium cosmopolitanum]|uniref:Uncharacterized protein n=1 Tax=Penicillium cosmopolitanum TaxID=1131564 RepID=A0A9X0BAR3_9EURO|nr:uncharacterized protein N7509_006199 [Penicillium cosmopolitanum]KAJ5398086.1 hypothetical protein N7509_006199 [Penicillium cosmopolitanum]